MSVIDHAISKISTLLGISTTTASSTLEAILDSREQERIAQVRRYWNYYNGHHYDYARQDGEMPYVNWVYGLVEKSIAWLIGKPPVLKGREDIHPLIEELYREVIENSGGDQLFYDAVQMGSVSGDVLLRVGYDPDVNHGKGGVMIYVMDSERTFWEYRNIGQKRKLTRVMTIWDELDPDTGELKTYSEVWSDQDVRVYPPGRVLSARGFASPLEHEPQPSVMTDDDGSEYAVYENPYGELPFVHIPNLFISQHAHGRSDVHDLWVLNKEANEQLLSYKDNVDYHGNPLTLLFGVSARQVEKGASKIWGNLPKDARVENLEVTQTHEAILKYMTMLKESLAFAHIPYYLTNATDPVKTDTSAAAMRLAFLPLVELTNRKRQTYGLGFKQAFEKALRFMNSLYDLQLDALDAPASRLDQKLEQMELTDSELGRKLTALRVQPYFYTEVQFQDHLPRNRALELADLSQELQIRVESLTGAMKRLGIADVEGKLAEILDSTRFVAENEAILAQSQAETSAMVTAALTPEEPPHQPDGISGGGYTGDDIPPEKAGDDRGGRGKKKPRENPVTNEQHTGQSADRTQAQRGMRGKGEL